MDASSLRFECNSIFSPKPTDPTHYFRTNEIDVGCSTAGDQPVVAARLAVDYFDIARAVSDGQSILHICDADSSAWMQVYEATIEPDIKFQISHDFATSLSAGVPIRIPSRGAVSQTIQRADHNRTDGIVHMRVNHRRLQGYVAQQNLNPSDNQCGFMQSMTS